MSAKSVTGKRPNQRSYSPDKDDVYEQDMNVWKRNRMAAKKYFRSFSNLTESNVRPSYIENNESPNTQPHDYETCQLRCCRVQRPNAGGSTMNKSKTVSVCAHARSPPNPKIEKQNKGTNVNKSVLLQQMEVLKRNRNLLAKRNIHSVSNLSTNSDRPTKVRRLNEGSGSNKSPNYRRILSTNDAKAKSASTLQQKCSFCNEMISRGETFSEHLKKVHGPKKPKPDIEIKRPYTDSRGNNLKSLVEEVHGRKKSDNEIRRPCTNSRGENLKSLVEEDTKANSSALQQKCPVCNKMISLGENLISHIDKVHGRNKLDKEIKRPYTDDSRGENFKSKVEEAHGSKKPEGEIKRPDTDSRGENLKSHVEEVHGSTNPDLEVKRLYNDSRGGVKKVRGSEIITSYTEVRGESSKANVDKVHEIKNPANSLGENSNSHLEKIHGSKKPGNEVKNSLGENSKSHIEKVHGMKTSVPLNKKRKSSVHEAKKAGWLR